jgi:HSP20 family protein
MAMTQWEPFDSMMSLREAVTRLFEESFVGPERADLMRFGRVMPLDIYETDGAFEVEAALPGVRPDDVEVTTQGSSITIEVTRRPVERNDNEGKYVRRERITGELTRTFELPRAIQSDQIAATFQHGMLQLHVPKAEHARPRRVPIRVTKEETLPR